MSTNNPVSLDDLRDKMATNNTDGETTINLSDTATSTDGVSVTETTDTSTYSGGHRPVDITAIRDYSGPAERPATILDDQFSKLDLAIDRNKNNIDQLIEEAADIVNAEADEEALDSNEDNTTNSDDNVVDVLAALNDTPKAKPVVKVKHSETQYKPPVNTEDDSNDTNVKQIFDSVDEDDFFKESDEVEEDEESSNADADVQFENAKKAIAKKIIPIQADKKVDLTTFSIRQKPISISKVLNEINTPELKKADWILWTASRSISMTELSGPDIEKLNVNESNRNNLNALMSLYRVFYDHIIDADKGSFEAWLKTTPFLDVQHLYFTAYRSSFGPDNSVPYNCTDDNCNEVFVNDVPFEDMIKYKDDVTREKVREILERDTTSADDDYEVELVQVSDDIVIAMKNPSIYNVVFEMAALPDDLRSKYSDMLSVMSYIDNIYIIDRNTNELLPIDTKPDPKNATKTVTRKVKAYYTILKKLTSDQYFNLAGYIKNIQDPATDITYVMPATTCPKCGKVIAETAHNSNELLFTRHQLGAIANM